MTGSSNNDFARQLAERNAELNPSVAKKFRSAAPKGSKLGSGYQDRTQVRTSEEEDDKAKRVKALEDMVKLGQMELATFEALRDEIVGGEVKDVHLVKGLDYKLLERVRRGEDVLSSNGKPDGTEKKDDEDYEQPKIDVDDEFEKLEEMETQPLAKEEKSKKGETASPRSLAGKKRTRDTILQELRASRLAAAAEAKARQPQLGPRFVKVGDKKATSRIEKDESGREILITVDAEGNVKRKVKKAKIEEDASDSHGLLMPDKDIAPLGMKAPLIAPLPGPQDDDDGDIFEGVGTDYNPFGDAEEDEDESDDSGDAAAEPPEIPLSTESPPPSITDADKTSMPPPPPPPKPGLSKRNYFTDTTEEDDGTRNGAAPNPLTDPTILAALKKASSINPIPSESSAISEEEAAKVARRKKMLETHDRDADDMDLGFGSSRFRDEEEGEEKRVKLSVWGADGGDDDEGGKGKGKGKGKGNGERKRGAKKRKGDANSAADVLKVMERRKGEVK